MVEAKDLKSFRCWFEANHGHQIKEMKMQQYDFTNSSFLASCQYDEEKQLLTVIFRNGKEYQYADVPKEVFEEFKDAESAGIYFSSQIKNKYQAPKKEEK